MEAIDRSANHRPATARDARGELICQRGLAGRHSSVDCDSNRVSQAQTCDARPKVVDDLRADHWLRRKAQRRAATPAQIASITPNGQAPCRKP